MLATPRTLTISLSLALGLGLMACSSPYRSVSLGTARAIVGKEATGQGVAVGQSGDRYQIEFHITTSEATELAVAVSCPGGEMETVVGESMASYRERRLAELRYQAQRREQTRARATSAVSAAVSSVAVVETPVARAEANVQVNAAAATAPAVETIVLGPHDRGAQSIHQTILLPGGGAGQCRMRLLPVAGAPALRGVSGYMEVTHLVDRAKARRRAREADTQVALGFRATIKADLIARGADPQLRERLALAEQEREDREAEARAAERRRVQQVRNAEIAEKRARERERRLEERQLAYRAEVSARPPAPARAAVTARPVVTPLVAPPVDAEVVRVRREYELAILLRRRLIGECVAGGADPYYRVRQRQARFDREQQQSLERERKVQAELEAQRDRERRRQQQLIADLGTRETLVAWLIAHGADPEYRRKQNEADLLSFEERSRRARFDAQRRATASLADTHVSEQAGVASVELDVVATVPRPAPPVEARPPQPDSQSSWIAGFYQWQGGAWVWMPGVWSTPPVQDAVWVPTVEIHLGGQLVTRPGSWRTRAGKRVHAGTSRRKAPKVRDHRR